MLPILALVGLVGSAAALAETTGGPACDALEEVSMLQQTLVLSGAAARESANTAARASTASTAGGVAAAAATVGERAADASGDDIAVSYGGSACKCLGIDHTQGFAIASIDGTNVTYPPDVGAHCAAWDKGTHPDCLTASPPDWCSQQWCYVDPCSCDTSTTPPTQAYFPQALYQDFPIHFSYETCGSVDSYTAEYYDDACLNQNTETDCLALGKCSWSLSQGCVGSSLSGIECDLLHSTNQVVWGSETCSCINIANRPGMVNATLENMTVGYPLSVGSMCEAWDEGHHPDCTGSGAKPEWCSFKWCYVDPCTCSGVTPVVSGMLPEANFHGYTLYYSYETCGFTDTYTSTGNVDACVNQQTQEECDASSDPCLWSFMGNDVGYVCRGIEVATYCAQTAADLKDGAAQLGSTAAVLLVALLAQFALAAPPSSAAGAAAAV